jgi:hypothetical protein
MLIAVKIVALPVLKKTQENTPQLWDLFHFNLLYRKLREYPDIFF